MAAVLDRRLEGPALHMKRSLRSWLWRLPIDQEIDEELALHVENRTRELVARGMDPKTAREVAVSRLGDIAALKKTMRSLGRKRDREMSVSLWVDELRNDLKSAFRQLRHSPGFTLVATLTLALGIGANSAIFALVDATLLRPLPSASPIGSSRSGKARRRTRKVTCRPSTCSTGTRAAARSRRWPASCQASAGWSWPARTATPKRCRGSGSPPGFSTCWASRRSRGARFRRRRGKRANAVVLSEPLWRGRFNADPTSIGREIRLDGSIGRSSASSQELRIAGADEHVGDETAGEPSAAGPGRLRPAGRGPPEARRVARGRRGRPGRRRRGAETEFPQTNKGRGVGLVRLHD